MRIRFTRINETGTTLAEVCISVAIIAITAGAMIGAFNYGFFQMQWARENQRATQIILEKAETIRLYNWDQINTSGFIPATVWEQYDPQGGTNQGISYRCDLSIGNVPFAVASGYQTNMRQLTVTLTWTNSGRTISRTRSLVTYVSRDGLQNYVY